MTATLQYFLVTDNYYQEVQTNTTTVGSPAPTIEPFTGTLTLTPSVAEIESVALDSTIYLDPITARWNQTMNATTYTVVLSDTWAGIAMKIGGVGITAAVLMAANPLESTLTPGDILVVPSALDGALRSINGSLGVQLVDNQNLGLTAGLLTYRGDYTNVVFDGVMGRNLNSFRFAAPGDNSTIDINTVTRLPL